MGLPGELFVLSGALIPHPKWNRKGVAFGQPRVNVPGFCEFGKVLLHYVHFKNKLSYVISTKKKGEEKGEPTENQQTSQIRLLRNKSGFAYKSSYLMKRVCLAKCI